MTVNVRKLKHSDLDSVKNISVNADQLKYVGTVEELLKDPPESWHFHVVTDDDEIVGFFNIDVGYSQNHPFARPNEIGLRAFFIDAASQGRGYGKSATEALGSYLKQEYSQYPSVALTVNCKNKSAYICYLRGGFDDTGELFHGGKAGPQHIMRMDIGPS